MKPIQKYDNDHYTWCHISTIIRYATRRIWNYVLLTGNITSRCKVTPIPITQEVIDRVEALAKKYGIKSPPKFKYC